MPKLRRSRRRVLHIFAAAAALAALPQLAVAQTPGQPLSAADQADVARVEEYLNGLRTLSARFLQVTDTGAISLGTLYLSRPGRLRLEYDPPVPILMVADGTFLIHYDKQLRTTSYLPLDSTPAGLLVRDKIVLGGELTVTAVERGPGSLRVTILRSKDPRAGRLTLVFRDRPLALINWQVVDAQGRTTRVQLSEERSDVALDPALFRFVAPEPPAETR